MFLKTWRCITIVLAVLALTMESAHVLELPQKMQYDAQMYASVLVETLQSPSQEHGEQQRLVRAQG